MRIFTLAELPGSLAPQLAALAWLDGDSPQDLAFLRRVQRSGIPTADYFGVYAVEDDQILAHVECIHPVVTTEEGPQTVLGVADVLTRPDVMGRGLATALIEDAHRRAKEDGRRWAMLWTHQSWGAHRLYLRMGYRNVYSPPAALRQIPRSAKRQTPREYSWAAATKKDLVRIERLQVAGSRGRIGFVPRPRGIFRARFRLGFRTPAQHWILRRGSSDVGYAYITPGTGSLWAHEVVVSAPEHSEPIVRSLEASAAGQWLTLGTTTFVTDATPLLARRGYAIYPSSHRVLMARPLDRDISKKDSQRFERTFSAPNFSCHRGDMF